MWRIVSLILVVCLVACMLMLDRAVQMLQSVNHNLGSTDSPVETLKPVEQPVILATKETPFFGEPLIEVDSEEYPNFFEQAGQRGGIIFRWNKPHLSYFIDKAVKRRLDKAKVSRAFDLWERKTGLFTFSEAAYQEQADIFVRLMSTSEKQRLGEAGPDAFVDGETFEVAGRTFREKIIKHATITISSEFFTIESMEYFNSTANDQGFQTLVHEIGHVLGLMGHSANPQHCMFYAADPFGKVCNRIVPDANTLAMLYGKPQLLFKDVYR